MYIFGAKFEKHSPIFLDLLLIQFITVYYSRKTKIGFLNPKTILRFNPSPPDLDSLYKPA